MKIVYTPNHVDSGAAAARDGIAFLRQTLAERDEANIILATGLSQFAMLSVLREADDIAWERVNAFHLDEYAGLSIRHPASFRIVLWNEFVKRLPVPLKSFTWIDGEADSDKEIARLTDAIKAHPVDVAFMGIGENGHIAFNDPPADFTTDKAFFVATLDEACRRQQHGEGWFKTLADVPERAITMSAPQILKSRKLIVTVPDERKSEAVKNMLTQKIDGRYPATILRTHPDCTVYLDEGAASRLDPLPAPDSVVSIPVESLS